MNPTIAGKGNPRAWLYTIIVATLLVLSAGCTQSGRVDPDNPDNYVLDATGGLILVSFQDPDNLPSKSVQSVLRQLDNKYADRVSIRQIDVASAPGWKKKYGIDVVPTICLFHYGQEVRRWVGMQSYSYMDRQVNTALQRYQSDQPVALTDLVDEEYRQ
jgi:thioredoxin-like negative regulator of GroEL